MSEISPAPSSRKTGKINHFVRVSLFLNLKPEGRIAAYALIVSLLSLVYTCTSTKRQMSMQIDTARNAVRPLMVTYRNRAKTEKKVGYQIINQGLGPAVILDLFFLYKDSVIKPAGLYDFADGINKRFWTDGATFYWENFSRGDAIRSTEARRVLEIDADSVDEAKFKNFTDDLILVIRYKSLTNDSFMSCSNRDLLPEKYIRLLTD